MCLCGMRVWAGTAGAMESGEWRRRLWGALRIEVCGAGAAPGVGDGVPTRIDGVHQEGNHPSVLGRVYLV